MPKTILFDKNIMVKVDKFAWERIRLISEKEGRTVSNFVRQIIYNDLDSRASAGDYSGLDADIYKDTSVLAAKNIKVEEYAKKVEADNIEKARNEEKKRIGVKKND